MKRFLAVLLAAFTITALCPAGVLAEQGDTPKTEQVTTVQTDLSQTDVASGETGQPADGTGRQTVSATEVKGLATDITKTPKSKIQDTIAITPGQNRTIHLQKYDETAKTWKTRSDFTTGTDQKARIVLSYPSDWKKENTSRWRIVIDETESAQGYVSETIQITLRNRKELKLRAKSAVIIDAETGQIFYGKSMNTKRANASTTKMMTAILALENKKLNSTVKVTKAAVNTPYSHLGKQAAGDQFLMKQLLYMAMLPSDNGAATALAIHTAGSEKAFAKLMNQKAAELGCTNTHFKNPHGLDAKGHYSTAKDLALIARYCMQNKHFRKIVGMKTYQFTTKKKRRKYTVNSTDKLLAKSKRVCGVKTGTTGNGGCCFVGAYKYRGKTYITVVLGDPSDYWRWEDTKELIRYIKKYM